MKKFINANLYRSNEASEFLSRTGAFVQSARVCSKPKSKST